MMQSSGVPHGQNLCLWKNRQLSSIKQSLVAVGSLATEKEDFGQQFQQKFCEN
jgi:hypothetical protein